MIVDEFHLVGAVPLPTETDPPSVVHPDAVLAAPVSSQQLETVPGRHPQVLQRFCRIEQEQLPMNPSL